MKEELIRVADLKAEFKAIDTLVKRMILEGHCKPCGYRWTARKKQPKKCPRCYRRLKKS